MNKETKKLMNKLTIQDLIKNKEKNKAKKNGDTTIKIERLDATVTIENPDRALCLDAIEMARNPETADQADKFLVYSVMKEPNLKDPELQKAYDCVEPTDIIDEIFEIGEISEIAMLALEKGGVKRGTISVVEDLKN